MCGSWTLTENGSFVGFFSRLCVFLPDSQVQIELGMRWTTSQPDFLISYNFVEIQINCQLMQWSSNEDIQSQDSVSALEASNGSTASDVNIVSFEGRSPFWIASFLSPINANFLSISQGFIAHLRTSRGRLFGDGCRTHTFSFQCR